MSDGKQPIAQRDSAATRFERGLAMAKQLGADPDPRLVASVGDLGQLLVEFVFGDIYSRTDLTLRDREVVAVAVLTALGHDAQLRMHAKAAIQVGVSWSELRETVLQTVPFAGFPCALNAMQVLSGVEHELASPKGSRP